MRKAISKLARIHWLTSEEGGRKALPAGVGMPPYLPTAAFSEAEEHADTVWSLAIEKYSDEGNELTWIAMVTYLADAAPQENLKLGNKFKLFEGPRLVATGEIIE